ncbi:hypothetical protein KA005_77420, partial [bacterium]|nr:hypothetical protein [bacterium]
MADDNNEGQNPTPEEEAAAATAAAETKGEEDMTEDELTALHADEDFIANFKDEDHNDPEKVTKLQEALKSAKTTIAQKKHYRGKYQAATKPPVEKKPAPKPTEKDSKDEKKVDPQVATEFRLDHPELSKEQQLKVIAHAGAYGNTPEEALKDPLMQGYIKSGQAKEDVEDASVSPARKAGTGIADRDWSTATPAEIE